MTDQAILEGIISVSAALRGQSRPVRAIYIAQDPWDPETHKLARAARQAGAPIERKTRAEVDALAQGSTHGGVAAAVGPRRFIELEALGQAAPNPFIVMLDGVEDPFNFGSALRSLYAAGADGLVLRARNWMSAAGTVARASAGASELIPTALAEDAAAAAQHLKTRGLRLACATLEHAQSIYETDLTGPLFLLIGGEKRGIHKSLLAQADLLFRVPYGRRFPQALDTASAAAVIAFEILRQRRGQGAGDRG
jgi:23S rRNA (guanosine2251-2'-O)-methyltransferase